MATFKATIFKDRQRRDKTWNVVIRFTHERRTRYISTTIYVTREDLTASFKIKNKSVADKCDVLIRGYREKLAALNLEINPMDMDTIMDYLKDKTGKETDFAAFARRWCAAHSALKGIRNYCTALNAFCRYVGKDAVPGGEVTARRMKGFEEYLSGKKRAPSLYTSAVTRMFKEMVERYNDEANGIIRVRDTLARYRPPRQNVARKRALTVDEVRAIFNLPYAGKRTGRGSCRRDLAKDCFMLSFCLMGMNSADLYEATEYDGENISYNRAKTRDRRSDGAFMSVRVHPLIRPLVEKYRGRERVFDFCKRFSSSMGFNLALNAGLKEIGKELGIEGLQFYAARHSMATIAVNKARISKYVVNDMLCHADPSLKITELYIQKDFAPINDANFKLIEYIFP